MVMTEESQAIEVEVVEIDGRTPPAKSTHGEESSPRHSWQDWQNWQNWQGQIRRLDGRWWPVWVIVGSVAVFLLLTMGVFVGILYLIFRILAGFLRAIFR